VPEQCNEHCRHTVKDIALFCFDGRKRRRGFERLGWVDHGRGVREATEVAFSRDGLEIAFIAGGDLWLMDTELRDPRQVTKTPEEERNPAFSPGDFDMTSVTFATLTFPSWSHV